MSFVHGYEGLASSYVSPLHYSNAGYHSSHHGHYISSVMQAPIVHHSHAVAPVEYAPPYVPMGLHSHVVAPSPVEYAPPYVPMGLYTSRYHHKGGYQSSHHSVIDSGLYGSTYLSRKHLKRALKYGLYSAPHVGSFVHDVGHLGHYGASFVHHAGHSGHYGAGMTFQRGDVYHYGTAPARVTGKFVTYKGYVYVSAHLHDVDSLVQIGDGDQLVDVQDDFEVAPGDADDIHVVNAHTWGSYGMVFSDGQVAGTSLNIAECGPSGIGKKTDMHELIARSDCGGKVAAVHGNHDVLLRKKATGKFVEHKGYVYVSAHLHDVDSLVQIGDGDQLVDLHHDFQVAPGDANDIEVVNAHTWGSYGMVFSDGQVAGTSLNIAECGPSGIGKKTDMHELIARSDCGGKVAAVHGNHDVLLRKLA